MKMEFFDKELAASRCGFDLLNPSMKYQMIDNGFPAHASEHLWTTSLLPKSSRPQSSEHGFTRLDLNPCTNYLDHSGFPKTASDTDSGTATTTTTDHLVPQHVNKQRSLFKTELCRSWEEKGRCPYGNKCQYAHGTRELRPVARHPKFKTEVCCTFVTTGTCPYGRRCRFIHKNVPITAIGNQVCDNTRQNGAYVSSSNSITASSRRLPIFVKLARGEL